MIEMTKEELDAKVLEAIRNGVTRAGELQKLLGIGMRPLDRSLQRLRRRDLIMYGGPGTTFSGWRERPATTKPAGAGATGPTGIGDG